MQNMMVVYSEEKKGQVFSLLQLCLKPFCTLVKQLLQNKNKNSKMQLLPIPKTNPCQGQRHLNIKDNYINKNNNINLR